MSSQDTEEELTSGNQLTRYKELERQIENYNRYLKVIQHLIKFKGKSIELQHHIFEEYTTTSPHIKYLLQNCSTNIRNHQVCLESLLYQEVTTKHLINTFKF